MNKILAYGSFFLLGIITAVLVGIYLKPESTAQAPIAVSENAGIDAEPIKYPPINSSDYIAKAAAKIASSVVNIDVVSRTVQRYDFFGRPFPQVTRGKGSGVIISKDGYIVTNNHVVEGAVNIMVKFSDGKEAGAALIGADPDSDLAVIKVSKNNLPAAELGDNKALKVGEWVIAVGNPLGFENTVTVGVVSALHRNFAVNDRTRFIDAIQTDAAINHGNSGGALANVHGQLIGINAVIAGGGNGEESGNIGIGFAIPVNTVRKVTKAIIANGKYERPWLGVGLGTIQELPYGKATLGENAPDGLVILQVVDGSPASAAGLQVHDVIMEMDSASVKDYWEFTSKLQEKKIGDNVLLKIWRKGNVINIKAVVGPRPH